MDPGSSKSFIRYFNGGNNDEAKGLELSNDGGFAVLATTRIQKAEADIPKTKIKVIKTDERGNPLWQRLYPGFGIPDRDYTASAIIANPDGGYIIVGNIIKSTGAFAGISRTYVLSIDENGVPLDSTDVAFTDGVAEDGKAVAIEASGNIVTLSTVGADKMNLTVIDKNTFATISKRQHSAGETTLASRLLTDNGKVLISGKNTLAGLTGVRLLRILPDSPTSDWDYLIGEPGYSIAGFDFCKYGTGYAIVGATNQKPDGSLATDTDVMVFRTDSEGNRQSFFDEKGELRTFASFPFDDPLTTENEDNQIDAGSSISVTLDGGLILLSSINSSAIKGRGDTEFYLIKIDPFGKREWSSSFGSRFKDEGIAIRPLKDGSFIALGTTTQGSLKILTLFKTNQYGKID